MDNNTPEVSEQSVPVIDEQVIVNQNSGKLYDLPKNPASAAPLKQQAVSPQPAAENHFPKARFLTPEMEIAEPNPLNTGHDDPWSGR